MEGGELASQVQLSTVAVIASVFGLGLTLISALGGVVKIWMRGYERLIEKRTDLKLKAMEQHNLNFMEHPFWGNLYAYLNTKLPLRVAPNEFKKQAAVEFIKVSWMVYEKWLKDDLLPYIKKDVSEYSIFEKIVEGGQKVKALRKIELQKAGMDDRIVAVFENQRASKIELKMELYKTVLYSKAYVDVYSRVWAILDLQNYLLEQMSDDTWQAVINANGSLYSLSFKGFINELK